MTRYAPMATPTLQITNGLIPEPAVKSHMTQREAHFTQEIRRIVNLSRSLRKSDERILRLIKHRDFRRQPDFAFRLSLGNVRHIFDQSF